MPNNIDFLVIGAQKSGTTSLFRYLSSHPDIYMPPKKELSFFSADERFASGFERYLQDNFFPTLPTQLIGEASPQYMCYTKCAARIYDCVPTARLIAVLRNPINRAYSHYRMARRRGFETRSFADSIESLIERGRVADEQVNGQTDFVQFGEYGRILSEFLKFFPRNRILIVWSEELDLITEQVMREAYKFLGVRDDFRSETFRRRFHRSGRRRLPEWVDRLVDRGLYSSRARRFFRQDWLMAIHFWYRTKLSIAPDSVDEMPADCRERLRRYYAEDIVTLQREFSVTVPWRDWQEATSHSDSVPSTSASSSVLVR